MKKSKKRAKCPCCGANGWVYRTPSSYPERKHIMDRSDDPETYDVVDSIFPTGSNWVSACIHFTGKLIECVNERFEYQCNCDCGEY